MASQSTTNERHRPEQTTPYRLVQQHVAMFFAQAEAQAGADLSQFVKDEFDAFLECGVLANSFLRLRCGDCGQDQLVAFSCKRHGFCPSCRARRMAQTAATHVTVSLGVCSGVAIAGSAATELVGQADAQLYLAKSQGRNRCHGALLVLPA